MKRSEISFRAEVKELDRLEKQLERRSKALAKAQAKAEKYGVESWTSTERNEWLNTIELDGIYIKNKEDQQKNGAWFDLLRAKDDVQETERAIEKCKARLEKKEEAFTETLAKEEEERISKRDDLIKETLEEMQKEWAKDGITLEGIDYGFYGTTPQGKRFAIYKNSRGYTLRSLHCFTLRIDTETVFTSGEFWRAYHIVRNS